MTDNYRLKGLELIMYNMDNIKDYAYNTDARIDELIDNKHKIRDKDIIKDIEDLQTFRKYRDDMIRETIYRCCKLGDNCVEYANYTLKELDKNKMILRKKFDTVYNKYKIYVSK